MVAGARRAPITGLDLDAVDRVLDASQPVITFLCSPNNPTGRAEPPEIVTVCSSGPRAWSWWTRRTGSSPRRSALELITARRPGADARWWWCARSPRRGRWRRVVSGYLVGDPEVVAACEAVVLPYHLDAMTQAAGRLALRYVDDMEARVALITEERGRIAAASGRPARRDMALGRQLRPLPSDRPGRHRCVAGPARGVGAGARLLELAGPRRLPAGHGGHPGGERPLPGRTASSLDRHGADAVPDLSVQGVTWATP